MAVNIERTNQLDEPVYGADGYIAWFSRKAYEEHLARTVDPEEPILESIPRDPNAGITFPADYQPLHSVPAEATNGFNEFDGAGQPTAQLVDGPIQHDLRIVEIPETQPAAPDTEPAEVTYIAPVVYAVSKPETQRFSGLIASKQVALGGLRRFVEMAKTAPQGAIELAKKPIDIAENLSRAASARAIAALMAATESIPKPEAIKPTKKTAISLIGTVALAGVGYLASSRGYLPHLGGSGHAQEAAANLAPKHSANHEVVQQAVLSKPVESLSPTGPLSSTLKPASNHAARAISAARDFKNTVNIRPGDGYTQAIANRFPNHSAVAYAQA